MMTRLEGSVFDAVVVGGGINGVVSAASAAAKGARVALIEGRDFASLSSQESSTLAWGGIKYLESYEFRLVWDLCKSRNALVRRFPSSVVETRFLTKISRGFRKPAPLVYAGTLLYWAMGRFRTRPPVYLTAKALREKEPRISTDNLGGAFEYSDSRFVDGDSRFAFGLVRAAVASGAVVANYAEVTRLDRRAGGIWEIAVEDVVGGEAYKVLARSVVNAGGAFADRLNEMAGIEMAHRHLLSKGVHLIVPRLTEHDHIITFFASDGRLFFALPMAGNTCIGTTDEIVDDPEVGVTDADRMFILDEINTQMNLERPLSEADIIAERCGVRPLALSKSEDSSLEGRDAFDISRRHVVDVDADARFLTVYGGKLTDCLNSGEEVCETLAQVGVELPRAEEMVRGESPPSAHEAFMSRADLVEEFLDLDPETAGTVMARWWRCYDVDAHHLLDRLTPQSRIQHASLTISDTEIAFIKETEMALCDEDVRRRRTGLAMAEGPGDAWGGGAAPLANPA